MSANNIQVIAEHLFVCLKWMGAKPEFLGNSSNTQECDLNRTTNIDNTNIYHLIYDTKHEKRIDEI